MHRNWIAVVAAAALLSASAETTLAQTAPAARPLQLAQDNRGGAGTLGGTGSSSGQTSGGATSGGATSGGAASEAPAPPPAAEAPAPPPPEAALPAGPAAGPMAPTFFANPFVIGGAVVTAAVVCALVCFGSSSSTTTTSAHN